ncbi:MAG TPA: hypothetical protein VJN88_15855 [Ktedonobacterales bacterium]|nr:hypothetical protein [Ktedonobacterales bacterium]
MKTVHAPEQSIPPQPEATTQPSESWGGRVVRRIGVFVSERVPASARVWRSLVARRAPLMRIAPLLVVAAAMLALAYVRYHEQKFYITPGLAGFADINTLAAKRLGIPNYGLVGNPIGYDGQFFFFMAYKPSFIWTCAHASVYCPALEPSFRWQRILYPAFARALALGHTPWIPFTLLLVNFIGVLVVVYLVGKMAVEMGASRWMGAAVGLFCGELLGFLRDLADPFGVLWIVVAIYLLRRNRPLWAAVAGAAAILTREQLVFYLPILALPLLAQRRWLTLLETAAITLIPFVAWQATLHALYGNWPFFAGDTQVATLTRFPFLGLWRTRHDYDFGVTLLCAGIPLAFAVVVSLAAIWHHGPRSLLRDPVPLMALVYCVLFSLVNYLQWADVWGAARLEDPGVVLAALAACALPWRSLRVSYGVVLALTAFAPFIEFVR